MEILIGHLLKLGARREHMEAKLFGGGNVLPELVYSNIGHKNAAFAINFLEAEGIRVAGSDLAKEYSRKVHYFPATGKAQVLNLQLHNDTVLQRDREYRDRLLQAPDGSAVELFIPARRVRRTSRSGEMG
jgi:chemotaxis protein CheD